MCQPAESIQRLVISPTTDLIMKMLPSVCLHLGSLLTSKGYTYMSTKETVKSVLISVKNSFIGLHKTN